MIEVRYNLNMVPDKGSPIHINVSQNDDKCRTFIFKLYSSDGSWTAPASATATIEGRKDDGKFFSFACTYSNGEVTVIVQQQMVAVAGKVRCKIKMVSGAETIESAPFYFVVNPKSMPVNADMSKSDVVDAVAKATQKIVDQVAESIPQDYVKLNEDVSGLKSDIDSDLGNAVKQYIDNNKIIKGYYGGFDNRIANDEYTCIKLANMKAGTYYVNSLSVPFTYFKNLQTGEVSSAKQLGFEEVGNASKELGTITVKFDFDVCLTNTNWAKYKMWANGELPQEYVYGVYSLNLEKSLVGKYIDQKILPIIAKTDDFNGLYNFMEPVKQYLLISEWVDNTFYTGADSITVANNYFTQKIENLPKGTYHFNRMSAPFTYIKNVDTGAVSKASDLGYSDVNGKETTITIDYNFNLYLTVYGVPTTIYPMWANGELPQEYKEGLYDINSNTLKPKKIYYCGSSREYKTLKGVIEEATKFMDCIVYVDAETFDLVEEFGEEYLDSYSGTNMIGIFLKNRIHVIFANGSKVLFDYKGSNTKVHEYFSPFNSGEHGFTLENAWIESKNCRYSVHDERGHSSDAYHNKYLRCTMIHDSSSCSWKAHQVIGGGLGQFGDILIEDGYYKSVGCADNISYHNTTLTGSSKAKSKVVIRGAYIDGTTLCANYGTSKEISQMFVCGCSLGAQPKLERVITEERADNMEVIAWGNTIRTN